jgi:hypothetical protein
MGGTGGGQGTDFDDVKVKGVDENGIDREIAAEQDDDGRWRLLIKAQSTAVAPSEKPNHFVSFLENGGSREMAIDGSVTSQIFSVGPAAGEIWYVYELQFLMADLKVEVRDRYGDISGGLTNGLLCESVIGGTPREIFNVVDNKEVAVIFDYEFSSKTQAGLANEDALFVGNLKFDNVIQLVGDDSDLIRLTVRDDLTGLNSQLMTLKAYEIL